MTAVHGPHSNSKSACVADPSPLGAPGELLACSLALAMARQGGRIWQADPSHCCQHHFARASVTALSWARASVRDPSAVLILARLLCRGTQ